MELQVTLTQVKDLRPDANDINLLCLVICKHSPRPIKSTRVHSTQRFVLSFTVRDASGCVNCSVWGGEEFVNSMSSIFKIGDMVVVTKAQVGLKGSCDETFNPSNSCPFTLYVHEKQGKVAACEEDCPELRGLLHAPIRPSNDYYTLAEIFEQGESMEGQFVNILAVVKKITDVQHLTTKNGKELEKMEITFFDNTSDAFTVVVWEREYFSYIQRWTEKRSVVFAVDVRLTVNKFRNCMQGTFTNKTICVRDPDTTEAHQLYDYALEYADQMEELFGDSKDERDGVNPRDEDLKVYTIEEVLKQRQLAEARGFSAGALEPAFMKGILYPVISSFNIDDKGRKVWCHRCSSCRYRLASIDSTCCPNEQCVTKEDPSKFAIDRVFDIEMSLSDHTGTLDQCRIGGKAAETMFGLSVDGFECLTSEDLTDLKWSWLMERCKIKLRYNLDHPAARPRIELCEKPDLEEALFAIKV